MYKMDATHGSIRPTMQPQAVYLPQVRREWRRQSLRNPTFAARQRELVLAGGILNDVQRVAFAGSPSIFQPFSSDYSHISGGGSASEPVAVLDVAARERCCLDPKVRNIIKMWWEFVTRKSGKR